MSDVNSNVLKAEEWFTSPQRVVIGRSSFADKCSNERGGGQGHQQDSGQWQEAWPVHILFTYFLVDMVASKTTHLFKLLHIQQSYRPHAQSR